MEDNKSKNSVVLIDYMGSDKLHSLSAWASTFLELGLEMPIDIEPRVDILVDYILSNSKRMRSLEGLLNYLADNRHNSPFRMSGFVFAMTTDIATHIQKLKHAVILEAENGESARYKELQDKFYLPDDWKNLKFSESENDLSMMSEMTPFYMTTDTWYDMLKLYTEFGNKLYHHCLKDLTPVLGRKRAKETARFFKTYNTQLNTINKFSFDGVMQFHYKRSALDAQREIAEISEMMLQCIKNIPGNPFQYSLKAFGY